MWSVAEGLFNLKNLIFFINSISHNENVSSCAHLLAQRNPERVVVMALKEQLPALSMLTNPQRKKRVEEILSLAAEESLHQAKTELEGVFASPATNIEVAALSGRFPDKLAEWLSGSAFDLLIKQPLQEEGSEDQCSKGDIKLTRHANCPVLLLPSPLVKGGPVLIGVAPHHYDEGLDEYFSERLKQAALWADLLEQKLVIVHSWELWAESLLRSKSSPEEVDQAVAKTKAEAHLAVERIVKRAELKPGSYEACIYKGHATQAITHAVAEYAPSLIILGSHASEKRPGTIIGNTAEALLRKSTTPIMIIH